MREIKFRAWNNEDKVMIDADHLAFEEYLPLKDQLASCTHLMQFTGLKDRNGVDIYEGDILKDSEMIHSVEFGEFGCDEWTFTGWLLKHKDKRVFKFGFSQLDANVSEIIGNIHQNKELLTP